MMARREMGLWLLLLAVLVLRLDANEHTHVLLIVGAAQNGKFMLARLLNRHPDVFFAGGLRKISHLTTQQQGLAMESDTKASPGTVIEKLKNTADRPVIVILADTAWLAGLDQKHRFGVLSQCALTVVVRRCDQLLGFAMSAPNAARSFDAKAFAEFRKAEGAAEHIPMSGSNTVQLMLERDLGSLFRARLTLQRIAAAVKLQGGLKIMLQDWTPPDLQASRRSSLFEQGAAVPARFAQPPPSLPTCISPEFPARDVLVMIPHARGQFLGNRSQYQSGYRPTSFFGGLMQRMVQVLNVLSAMGLRLHVVSEGPISLPREAWLPPTAKLYAPIAPFPMKPILRPLDEQLEDVRKVSADPTFGAKFGTFVGFFTEVTMRLRDAALGKTPAKTPWYLEPPPGFYSIERVLKFVRTHLDGVGNRTVRSVLVVDDVHYKRTPVVLKTVPGVQPAQLDMVQRWLQVREAQIYSSCDAVLAVSDEDAVSFQALVANRRNARGSVAMSAFLPMASESICRTHVARFEDRRGAMYTGNPHVVALKGVGWFLENALPRVANLMVATGLKAQTDKLFKLVGKWDKGDGKRVIDEATKGNQSLFDVLGQLPDESLELMYQRSRAFVVPQFNATGVATKTIKALGRGLPIVTTSNGLSGLNSSPYLADAVWVADDAETFAQQVVTLLTQPAVWAKASAAALDHVDEALSYERMCKVLLRVMEP